MCDSVNENDQSERLVIVIIEMMFEAQENNI